MRTVLSLAVALLSFSGLAAEGARQRCIIADFEDVGTWRPVGQGGINPGAFFAGGLWMGGSQAARHADDWVGELRFDFAEETSTSRWLGFRRYKMSQITGYLDGIEFDADSRGRPVALRFVLLDATKKRHSTPLVKLGASGWRRHRLELNEATWPGLKAVTFPAGVEQVVLVSDEGGEGSVFIDDLALTGAFTRKDRLALTPLYERLAYAPGKPLALEYRARNATDAALPLEAELVVESVAGERVFSGQAKAVAEGHGSARLRFSLPALPVGAYEAALEVKGGELVARYGDTFGVFVPNGARLNRKPMWFGVQDPTIWQTPAENRLHLDWMRQIGIDINRLGMTAGRFDLSKPRSLQGWRELIQPFEDAGIDSALLYFETPPELLDVGKNPRTAPNDLAAFERYAADVGAFFGAYKRIKYVEFWNEPDIDFFHGTMEEYWGMFRAFSKGIRASAPHLKITTGGATVRHPREKPGFNEELYSKNGDLYDVTAFHAHGPLNNYAERQRLVEEWQAKGGIQKPIANTETGDRSGYDPRGRAEQAVTLVKKLAYAKSRPGSEFYIWFTLQDYWDMDPDADDSFGLITTDNRAKPSLVAYNELIRQLANTTPTAAPAWPQGVEAYPFLRDDGRHVLVCWAAKGTSGGAFWIRSGKRVEKVSVFGAAESLSVAAGGQIFVEKEPFYLVSDEALAPLPKDAVPLSAPSEVYRDVGAPTTFAVTVRNLGGAAAGQNLALRSPSGAELWTETKTLSAGESAELAVEIPATPGAGMVTTRLTLELTTDEGRIVAPVLAHGSYPIVTGDGERLRLAAAQEVTELTFDPSIRAWQSPQDLSVDAQLTRDGAALVFRFEVSDDKHVQANPDDRLWRGDSVQVAFYDPANGAHSLFDLGLRDGEPVAWCHRNADPALKGLWSIPLTIVREDARTRYEAKVPLSHLGIPADAPAGLPVRFSFLVNEDDGQGRVRWMSWRGGLGKNEDVQQLGHGILR